jgi:hypothetical protein
MVPGRGFSPCQDALQLSLNIFVRGAIRLAKSRIAAYQQKFRLSYQATPPSWSPLQFSPPARDYLPQVIQMTDAHFILPTDCPSPDFFELTGA